MTKKVATLTFVDTPNYGALLQAFALQQYIKKQGYECAVIHYKNKKRKFSQVSGLRKVRSFIWQNTFARFFSNRIRDQRTNWFRKNILTLTRQSYSNNEELKELNQSFDTFVVGSDQVWNPMNNANDPAYLLNFVASEKKRIAYAASFGTANVKKEYLKDNADYFLRFNSLSVREESGKEQLERVLGVESVVVPDPVFLLEKDNWIDLVNSYSECDPKAEYVLCYVLPGNRMVEECLNRLARRIADELCIDVITIGKKTTAKKCRGERIIHDCGPVEFLDYLINSRIVITNSFHGTAFSIVMKKDFWTVTGKGALGARNTRLTNLLGSIGLQDREIPSDAVDYEDSLLTPIDYAKIDDSINKLITSGRVFINKAIQAP